MRYEDIVFPDTPVCHAALEVATKYQTPSLLNHSIRAYVFAAAHGQANGIAFDAELLYVSAMLHDLGLTPEFDSHAVPFEEAGGHVAWAFTAGAGWPEERRTRAAEVIVRHMWDEVPVDRDPEGHLLELSTAMDISGRRTEDIPPDVRDEALRRHPRLDLAAEFAGCITEQGRRKPSSVAGSALRGGVLDRIAANPLDRL
ncbi:HD domain-containing protein [Nonomuraea sp. MCN248]|uniref:HD domain-containing protein n=1 Tax=Nonomuraea corallina TaxID=2989783 RepID=A0ABT4SHB7_9ACTN|nr:HD domain-containing protein [Nonomuraea corallina]MDA0636609.1 HD domain-containing protein [Nonomuraea corallina]